MALNRSYKTDALVLRGRALGEADRIFTLFTTEHGKIDAVAKGVRRTKSHLAGRLEFGNEISATMHKGRTLDVIVTADLRNAPWERLVVPERFAVASMVVELVDTFCEPELPLPDVYTLLQQALQAIAGSDEPQRVLPRFSLRLLSLLGLEPPLQQCIRCGRDFVGARAWVDGDAGGFACETCHERWREAVELDAEDLENLRALAAPRASGRRATITARPAAAKAIETLVAHHLGRRPKAGLHLSEIVARTT